VRWHDVERDIWMVHSGGFYRILRRRVKSGARLL
jgi:hypothetical protein